MPVIDLNFNSPKNYTTFKVGLWRYVLQRKYRTCGSKFFHITGKYTKKYGTDYAAGSTIKLVDNFPAFLFTAP